jgi:hypothetical protein
MFGKLKDFILKHNRVYHIAPTKIFKKPRYYVIRRHPPGAGFFSNYLYVLCAIMYAKKRGYLPVVDMQRYKTLYNEDRAVEGINNAWEYYFEQPEGASLADAYKSGNYILSNSLDFHREYLPFTEGANKFAIDDKKLGEMHEALQRYIVPRQNILSEINAKMGEYFTGKVVLGVHYRGTDKRKHNGGHFLSVEFDNFVKKIDEITQSLKVDYIFVCSDEEEAIRFLADRFPGKVIFNQAYRSGKGDVRGLHFEQNNTRENHKYLLGKEVLEDTILLSKCDYLLHSHSNVTNASIIMANGGFKKREFIENTVYI